MALNLEEFYPFAAPCETRWYRPMKRCFDVVFASAGLLAASPLMLALAVWVRLDSRGPILYRQTRVGKEGREFDILKFRTMRAEAEQETGPVWAQKNDDRVTRAGRVLRKLYLDELPQLWNVLRGDMSVVGPRPERPYFYPKCEAQVPGFSSRCLVKPGLTGLAQVRQCHEASIASMRRKFAYDRYYISHRSFRMDLYIIWRTGVVLIRELF